MTKWEDYFEIRERVAHHEFKYDVIIKKSDECVGSYNDFAYAMKQAKYKFKKMTRKIERILLG